MLHLEFVKTRKFKAKVKIRERHEKERKKSSEMNLLYDKSERLETNNSRNAIHSIYRYIYMGVFLSNGRLSGLNHSSFQQKYASGQAFPRTDERTFAKHLSRTLHANCLHISEPGEPAEGHEIATAC